VQDVVSPVKGTNVLCPRSSIVNAAAVVILYVIICVLSTITVAGVTIALVSGGRFIVIAAVTAGCVVIVSIRFVASLEIQ
jgi:hypothetical protein